MDFEKKFFRMEPCEERGWPEVNRSSELRILERSGNRAGRNEYIEKQDFKTVIQDMVLRCGQKIDIFRSTI